MIRTCKSCGQQNRIPAKHLAQTGRCGKCQTELPPDGEPLEVGDSEFREIVAQASVPILVDFWAEWCPPCRMAGPHVRKVAQAMAGKALVLKVNSDHSPGLAREFDVSGIPNFVVLKAGKVVSQQAGLVDHRTMQRWLEQAA
jgi:thioredoxin 2